MTSIFDNVKVLELAEWTLVPAAAAILAEWGADVTKIERPVGGDSQRGLAVGGVTPEWNGVALQMEYTNRGGKRSVGVDVTQPDGRELVLRLAAQADVFLTSLLPETQDRLGMNALALRDVNPRIIYASGHGLGTEGPDSNKGGYDMNAYWCRGGVGYALSEPGEHPVRMRPAMGDRMASMNLVAGVASALFRRERTGEPSVVEVSLLGSAIWQLASDVVYSKAFGIENSRVTRGANPLTGYYQTADDRWLSFVLMQSDRWWPRFTEAIGAPGLTDDVRFADSGRRAENYEACVAEIRKIIQSDTLTNWRTRLAGFDGPWAAMQSMAELLADPQVIANGYVVDVPSGSGVDVPVVTSPMRFAGVAGRYDPCPEAGQHTEEVLLELGEDWDRIIALKEQGVIT
ncbi:MAG TPA: CaiB/BaiF CoA-transferase family protein [Jatrophihabitantaceae bacterium]|jgi:crotonobetainyl-CoA:carnitine CoA-transferase CaiB-like acyl-CoA transferase|nr:CaiB/BaiF CoA-transferase family protein [Jatrophihabitantaceae bacterium]